ncbi:MAG: esterase-like activity of phytase family protein [Hyphomicrobiaceae bacterium]
MALTSRLAAVLTCCAVLAAAMHYHVFARELAVMPATGDHAITITVRPVSYFQSSQTSRKTFGKLEFRGGLVLNSSASGFGGWSGITMDPDGRHFLAISDEGSWLSGEVTYQGLRPTGITHARMGRLKALSGRDLGRKRDFDAESVRLISGDLDKGTVLISFERNHRIGVFPVANGVVSKPRHYLALNRDIRRMSANRGFEAIATLKGGRYRGNVIAFSERYPGLKNRHRGWLWIGGKPQRLEMTDIGGFDVTDCVGLEDGSLLILERRFRWTEGVKMRIRHIPADKIRPGGLLDGETLLEADLGYTIDNMEGLAAHRAANGDLVLTLLSDNNFNQILQRTLLLQFTLKGHRQSAKG